MNRPNRLRTGWWVFVLALAATTLYFAYSLIGILVFELFSYYAADL